LLEKERHEDCRKRESTAGQRAGGEKNQSPAIRLHGVATNTARIQSTTALAGAHENMSPAERLIAANPETCQKNFD
jgi:hypothetical protein